MASLQLRGKIFACVFRHGGKRHWVKLGRVDRREAEAFAGKVDHYLLRLEQRLLTLPPEVSIVDFILADGKLTEKPVTAKQKPNPTLAEIRDQYLAAHAFGALEENTLVTIRIHFRHMEETFGADFCLQTISLADLQRHINRRAKLKGNRGKYISATTLKKDVVTLRAAWNWAVNLGLLEGRLSIKGLIYPKSVEKPPFQTIEEVERKVARGGLTKEEIADFWDSLFLTHEELDGLLKHAQANGTAPWVYPMLCFAAHTGARRSELLRLRIDDVDLQANRAKITEKKRVKGKTSSRFVPVTSFLKNTIEEWLKQHPGGPMLFGEINQRKRTPRTIGVDEAHRRFKSTFRNSRWKVVRGWHVLRHTFISQCAMANVDQRLIDSWVGHTTEEMRRRYRHLYPNAEFENLTRVFDQRNTIR